MTGHPPWLQRHLATTGQLNADGINRQARARHCPTCRAPTINGLDADHAALPARVDPTPLTPAGEVEALMTGRYTYDIRATPGIITIDYRNIDHIQNHPAGTQKGTDVYPAHKCGHTIKGTTTTQFDTTTPPTNQHPTY